MTLTDKISHAAERKAFETLLDNLIKKGQTQDASQVASDLVAMVQRLHGDVWSEKSFQTLRMIANDPNGKWAHYTQRLLRDNDPYILKTFLTNAVYEGGIRGYHVAQETAAKYDINVPWLISDGPDLRVQHALHGLLGGGIRPQTEPHVRGNGQDAHRGQGARHARVPLYRR